MKNWQSNIYMSVTSVISKSRDSVNTMRDIYAYILCNSYRVKENKNILARLLNFS